LGWTEELARFFFLWIATLSAGYAFKTKSHFALSFVVNLFEAATKKVIATVVMLIRAVFLILFTWKAIEYTASAADHYGPSTGLSMAIPYSSAVLAGFLMLFYIIKNWYLDIFNNSRSKKVAR
jgi:TRAP-type C4-dicarboxylate transport system permease small subunit